MSQARSTGVFVGTDETTGVTIATTASATGSEVDVLGDNASSGFLVLYLVFTSTVTAGSIDVYVNNRRVSGQAYENVNPTVSIKPINGTVKYILGIFPASRYMNVRVHNNATGANATNVTVGYELFKAA